MLPRRTLKGALTGIDAGVGLSVKPLRLSTLLDH